MTKQFDHIINWELKAGSHEFPGPKGGTCINEAAIVAAGFEYRRVKNWKDCPPCFSPVLAGFAIAVNDMLDDAGRQALMPLVTRLAGSRDDEDWVERARAEFIMREIDRDIFEPVDRWALDGYRRYSPEVSREMENARADSASAAGRNPATAIMSYASALTELTHLIRLAGSVRWVPPADLSAIRVDEPCSLTASYEVRVIDRHQVWAAAALALTRAFRIGTQAPIADTAKVVERMEAAKKLQPA